MKENGEAGRVYQPLSSFAHLSSLFLLYFWSPSINKKKVHEGIKCLATPFQIFNTERDALFYALTITGGNKKKCLLTLAYYFGPARWCRPINIREISHLLSVADGSKKTVPIPTHISPMPPFE